ncbi:MAG TPA: hypothetical protein VFW78_02655 [Bacteroidia bacterium]|nr:hypothetical protein [Bacteroidia bacterium]
MKELTAPGILDKFRNIKSEVRNFLKLKNKIALDIGCEYPHQLVSLYHDIGFDRCFGFEKYSEIKSIESHKIRNANLPNLNYLSIYEIYKAEFLPDSCDIQERRKLLCEDEFKNIINVNYGVEYPNVTTINGYSEFDLVILSNCLFKNSKIKYLPMLTAAKKNLKSNGILYVQVSHQSREGHEENFSSNDFHNLFHDLKEIHFNDYVKFDRQNYYMVYLGQKTK